MLELNENNLNGLLPTDISQLAELKHVFVRRNSLTGAIPPKSAICRTS